MGRDMVAEEGGEEMAFVKTGAPETGVRIADGDEPEEADVREEVEDGEQEEDDDDAAGTI